MNRLNLVFYSNSVKTTQEKTKFGETIPSDNIRQHTLLLPHCVYIVSTSCPQHCVYSSYIFNNDVMLNRFNNILDNLPAVVLAWWSFTNSNACKPPACPKSSCPLKISFKLDVTWCWLVDGHNSSQKIFKHSNPMSKMDDAWILNFWGTTDVTITMEAMVTTKSNFNVLFNPFLLVPFRVASNNKEQMVVKDCNPSMIHGANDLQVQQ